MICKVLKKSAVKAKILSKIRKIMDIYFSEKDRPMANKHMKKLLSIT